MRKSQYEDTSEAKVANRVGCANVSNEDGTLRRHHTKMSKGAMGVVGFTSDTVFFEGGSGVRALSALPRERTCVTV